MMAEGSQPKGRSVLQRALAIAAAVALLCVQIAFTFSEGFSAAGWMFALAVSGILLTVAFWGTSLKPAPRTVAGDPAALPLDADQVEQENEVDLDPADEVAERARALAAALGNAEAPRAETEERGPEPIAKTRSRELVIREACLWLMLGLVSLRRALGDEDCVRRSAYLKLQHAVLDTIFAARRDGSSSTEDFDQDKADEVRRDMQQVKAALIKGCSAPKGTVRPEQDLIAWFAERTGIDPSQNEHVGRALSGKTWPQ